MTDQEQDIGILIGRLVDQETGEAAFTQFEEKAEQEPALWRQLARQQWDAGRLAHAVEYEIEATGHVTSHAGTGARTGGASTWRSLLPAVSGWAAALIICLSWVSRDPDGTMRPETTVLHPVEQAVEHYTKYLDAPFVLGDMTPEVVDTEVLTDGRIAVHFIRRIEEVTFLNPGQELPVDERGFLISDPRKLRLKDGGIGEDAGDHAVDG